IIEGGGPVVTIGDLTGATAPAVAISRVTVTGGLTTGTVIAAGGGIFIPGPDSGNATAAPVSLHGTVIRGNRARVSTAAAPGAPCGPPKGKQCSYAQGGGIENAGYLTLTNTQVTDNVADDHAANTALFANAGSGGINSHPHAKLTLSNSVVSGNRATAS